MDNFCFSRPRFFGVTVSFVVALVVFATPSRLHAQLPDDLAKMVGAIPLTTGLLESVEKVVKTLGGDATAKAEWAAVNKDPSLTPDNLGQIVGSKHPKLAALFKSAGVSAEDFNKAMTALVATGGLIDLAASGISTGTDKTIQANVAFYKANKERCVAVVDALEALDKDISSSLPSSSPAS